MPQLLADAVRHSEGVASGSNASERVHWLECFTGKERISEFCEATDPAGNLESNSSSGYKEYQDRLRCIALRQEGQEKAEIAASLGRSAKFVQTWWKKEPKEVPRPPGVHEYLKTEFWRDVQIVRGFGKGLGIYDEVVPSVEWLQQMADGSAFKGGYRLKYDKEGRMRPQGNQHAKDGLVPGRLPTLDRLTQKLLSEQNIDDRVLKRPGILWYPDGSADAIEHRHEAWTALLSFGAPRILTIDKHPVLLRDGDLIVFGTQRHGVPKMHDPHGTFEDYGGRISVVFFFMPTGKQASGAEPWKAIVDSDGPSRKMTAMVRDADFGAVAQMQGLKTGPKAAEIAQLKDLGFSEEEAAAALKATGFDLERAAEVLLGGGGPALMIGLGTDQQTGLALPGNSFGRQEQIAALYARLEEIQRAKAARTNSASGAACSAAGAELSGFDDEELARRLQQEEEASTFGGRTAFGSCDTCFGGTDWEEMAVLEQLQELEGEENTAASREALQSQFAAYDEMLDAQDADDWDGRGDLMVRSWRRAHLHIEQQNPATLYAYGCGSLKEQVFFELLSLHSIRVLYDFRAKPESTLCPHFQTRNLELACKSRGILYRHIALGRETAYGILKHLREDEGRNSLAEVVWHAQRKRTALLGEEDDWRIDHRLAIGARLQEAGHTVLHVRSDGGTEQQPEQMEMPDHIAGEEARLRMLEKQRASGDLKRAHKSAAFRSTEAVAQRLAQPQKEIDVGAELRQANTQAELCRIQRRMADLQRRTEDSSDAKAGLGPKLLHVNKWVQAQAVQQRENLAVGKTKDGKEKSAAKEAIGGPAPAYSWTGGGGTGGGNPDFRANSSHSRALASTTAACAAEPPAAEECTTKDMRDSDHLLVECLLCQVMLPWSCLQDGNGICENCMIAAAVESVAAQTGAGSAGSGGWSRATAEQSKDVDVSCDRAAEDALGACVGAVASPDAPPVKSSWRAKRRAQRVAADV